MNYLLPKFGDERHMINKWKSELETSPRFLLAGLKAVLLAQKHAPIRTLRGTKSHTIKNWKQVHVAALLPTQAARAATR